MSNFTPIPQAELDEMQAREETATEGPWEVEESGIFDFKGKPVLAAFDKNCNPCDIDWYDADADFIAHSRTDQPRLRISLEAAQADIERLREACLGLIEAERIPLSSLQRDAFIGGAIRQAKKALGHD